MCEMGDCDCRFLGLPGLGALAGFLVVGVGV